MGPLVLGTIGLALFAGVSVMGIQSMAPEPIIVDESSTQISEGFNALYTAVELYRRENGELPATESQFIGSYLMKPNPSFVNSSGEWSYTYATTAEGHGNAYICLNGLINDIDYKAINMATNTIPGSGVSLVLSDACGDPGVSPVMVDPNGGEVRAAMTLWVEGPDGMTSDGDEAWANFFTHHGHVPPASWSTGSLSLSGYPGHSITGQITNMASTTAPYDMDSGRLPNEPYPSSGFTSFNLRNGANLNHVNSLVSVRNASSIDLSGTGLSSVSGLSNLQTVSGSIDLSNNSLGSLNGLGQLTSAGAVVISNSNLSSVSVLSNLTSVAAIDFSNNRLSNVNGLNGVVTLNSLDLSGNILSNLSGLSALSGVSGLLNLSDNQLTSLGGLVSISSLGSLNASQNMLTDISTLSLIATIDTLNLSRNNLIGTQGLHNIMSATQIDLSHNSLRELNLNSLRNVGALTLTDNQLTDLTGLSGLLSATHLFLGNNRLTSLDGLENIISLTQLDIAGNPNLTDVRGIKNIANVSGYINISSGSEFTEKNESVDPICIGIQSGSVPVRQDGVSLSSIDALALLCDNPPRDPLVMVFDTNLGISGGDRRVLVSVADRSGINIDWGDESANASCQRTISDGAGIATATCLYQANGVYTVSLSGNARVFQLYGMSGDTSHAGKLVSVESFGDLGAEQYLFSYAQNLISIPSSLPLSVTSTNRMFYSAYSFNYPIGSWDVSNVTDMGGMFGHTWAFNQPLDSWNVASVTNMRAMFDGARAFNQPIGAWDTSSVVDMAYMFRNARVFNQPIESWNTGRVTTMQGMFFVTNPTTAPTVFNQSLSKWNVSSVTNMAAMFNKATNFNADLSEWDVSNVTTMNEMFLAAYAFNQPIESWDVSNVTQMISMFSGALAFNRPIGSWDTSSVIAMNSMLENARQFNQDISCWNVQQFSVAPAYFNRNANAAWIGNPSFQPRWGKASPCGPQPMQLTFNTGMGLRGATSDVAIVLYQPNGVRIDWGDDAANSLCPRIMPNSAGERSVTCRYPSHGVYTVSVSGQAREVKSAYNVLLEQKLIRVEAFGDLGATNYSFLREANLTYVPDTLPETVNSLANMFTNATSFNHPNVLLWDTSRITDMRGAFSTASAFNQPINVWNVSNVTDMSSMFMYATSFRQSLNSWNTSKVRNMMGMFGYIAGFNGDISSWDTGNVENMSTMFVVASPAVGVFNRNISGWNTGRVTNMSHMFQGQGSFNQPIGVWNTSRVTDFSGMFSGAANFNQPLGGWSTSNAIRMTHMFMRATSFNRSLSNFDMSNVTATAYMFMNASAFNQPIGNWNTSKVTVMTGMFQGASSFNRDLACWNVQVIGAAPANFNNNANATWVANTSRQPRWGQSPPATCH